MYCKNFLSSSDIRSADYDLTIKTARTHNCRIKDIHTVGRCHDDDSLVDSETIHLNKHLV